MEQYVFDYYQGVAPHEAGHAVISWVLGRRLIRVSILPNATGDGCTEHAPDATTHEDLIFEAAITLSGGPAAELWDLITNDDDDRCRAHEMLCGRFVNPQAKLVMKQIQECLKQNIGDFRECIGALGSALLERKELCGKQAEEIIESSSTGVGNLARCLSEIATPNR